VDGARWVRKEVLDRRPDLDIAVIAVWLPVLAGDTPASAEANFELLDTPRVRQFYDADASTGRWVHDHFVVADPRLASKRLFARGVTWDAFFLYGPGTSWDEAPKHALASGGPIVQESAILSAAVERLVRASGSPDAK